MAAWESYNEELGAILIKAQADVIAKFSIDENIFDEVLNHLVETENGEFMLVHTKVPAQIL